MFLEMFTILGALTGAAITLVSGQRVLFIAFGVVLLASWGALFLQRHGGWRPVAHQDRMLTPFVRVLVSMTYFLVAERNWKYTVFTAFVLTVLTYSLFLR